MNAEVSGNIHATCIKIGQAGILLLGKSGSGKSDLALRLIMNKNACLVADDRVELAVSAKNIKASAPVVLSGLLEIRGVGIMKIPYEKSADVRLVVQLEDDPGKIERMPEEESYVYGDVTIPLIRLYAFEASTPDKIVIKLKAVLDKF